MLFDDLLKQNRRLRLEALKLSQELETDAELTRIMKEYLEVYCNYYGLSADDISTCYDNFARQYQGDLHRFYETGKYPAELGEDPAGLSRTDYDIALILSVLLNAPRHQIFKSFLSTVSKLNGQKLLFIGIGAAIELFILKQLKVEVSVDAYDISINRFVLDYFTEFRLHERLYETPDQAYDLIFAIELLEHLKAPLALTELCYRSLADGGRLVVTTAINMPQFDHLYNFAGDSYIADAKQLGFTVGQYEEFVQPYAREVVSSNEWIVFQKPHQ